MEILDDELAGKPKIKKRLILEHYILIAYWVGTLYAIINTIQIDNSVSIVRLIALSLLTVSTVAILYDRRNALPTVALLTCIALLGLVSFFPIKSLFSIRIGFLTIGFRPLYLFILAFLFRERKTQFKVMLPRLFGTDEASLKKSSILVKTHFRNQFKGLSEIEIRKRLEQNLNEHARAALEELLQEQTDANTVQDTPE